ncbi:MAG: transaldolase [Planctomycetes bacterium]|nr:transaldolase [Planctomycetota bacterium]
MIDDVSKAAGLLKGVYERSNHTDGYVSIEVPPRYAYNPDETVKSGRRLFKQIGKPNIMIKVPGTSQGLPAIRRLVAEGININVTLLFSKSQYEAITDAYIAGLNDRLTAKLPLKDIFSVASVFVSRIDTKIDNMLDKSPNLKGKAAVANSKVMYQVYKEIFWGDRFKKLVSAGANRQRILWASTSTKNPAYSATKYVEELLGPDSINTIPPQTIQSCKEKGMAHGDIACGLPDAHKVIQDLAKLGIDVNQVGDEIQKEGVKAFEDSYNKLLSAIRVKSAKSV